MALIAIVKKELVDKKGILTDTQILDGVSLASILPGPVAVNAVVYYSYLLAGIKGALVGFAGILLPTFVLVTGFSIYYFSSGSADIDVHISFVIPVVVAVIAHVGYKMARKQIQFVSQFVLMTLTFVIGIFATNAFFLIATIIMGGVLGYFLYGKPASPASHKKIRVTFISTKEMTVLGIVILGVLLVMGLVSWATDQLQTSSMLASVFSGMALTLFGGGYVIIPIMEQAVVYDLGWLTVSEFNAAISISQVTPGPIMTSVTFIGYKMGGIVGAIVGTLAIFMPSSLVMIVLSRFQQSIKGHVHVDAVMKGMRAVVIGLIFSGAYSIGIKHFDQTIPWILFITAFLLFVFTKIHPAILILLALLLSFI